MEEKIKELKSRLREVFDLGCVRSLLGWDQNTYMPPGGAEARGRQLALLSRLSHEKFTSPEIGKRAGSTIERRMCRRSSRRRWRVTGRRRTMRG